MIDYAFLDPSGIILSLGQTSSAVPAGAVVLSTDQYATAEAALSDGYRSRLVDGVLRLLHGAASTDQGLDLLRVPAYAEIDRQAEVARGLFLVNDPLDPSSVPDTNEWLGIERDVRLWWADTPRTARVQATTSPPRAWVDPSPAGPPALGPGVPDLEPTLDYTRYPWLKMVWEWNLSFITDPTARALFTFSLVAGAYAGYVRQSLLFFTLIKQLRLTAKLQVTLATSAAAIAAVVNFLEWPVENIDPSASPYASQWRYAALGAQTLAAGRTAAPRARATAFGGEASIASARLASPHAAALALASSVAGLAAVRTGAPLAQAAPLGGALAIAALRTASPRAETISWAGAVALAAARTGAPGAIGSVGLASAADGRVFADTGLMPTAQAVGLASAADGRVFAGTGLPTAQAVATA